VLVEIDQGLDQAGEDKLAGCSKVSDQRRRMNDHRDTYILVRATRHVLTVDDRSLAAVCGGDELTVLRQIGWCCAMQSSKHHDSQFEVHTLPD